MMCESNRGVCGGIGIVVLLSAAVLVACGIAGDTPTGAEGQGRAKGGAGARNNSPTEAPPSPFSYDPYDALLKNYVDEKGLVDYEALKANRGTLDKFIASLGPISPGVFKTWSESARLAFWINAYNAITLRHIIDHYPIEKGGLLAGMRYPKNSIRQIRGVWDKLTTNIAGLERTLEAIEHDILRKEFPEPRIHLAIVCASIGCPPLRDEAYTGAKLEGQLADQATNFLASPRQFRIDRQRNVVNLSSIFDWFGEDFIERHGTKEAFSGHGKTERAVLNFITHYVSENDARYLTESKYAIDYLDYDWSLNEQ